MSIVQLESGLKGVLRAGRQAETCDKQHCSEAPSAYDAKSFFSLVRRLQRGCA